MLSIESFLSTCRSEIIPRKTKEREYFEVDNLSAEESKGARLWIPTTMAIRISQLITVQI